MGQIEKKSHRNLKIKISRKYQLRKIHLEKVLETLIGPKINVTM